jgi:hypothetical protein
MSLEQVTVAIHELTRSMAAMQSYLASSQQPLQSAVASLPPVFPCGMPQSGATGVPIHLLKMSSSPSLILSYALASTVGPVYTTATSPATMTMAAPAPTTGAMILHGGAAQPHPYAEGVFYGCVDGPLLYGGSVQAGHSGASPSSASAPGSSLGHGAGQGTHPPRFYKLEFTTYDGAEDPLNWLNHCEQFFRGQRTLALDRTWFTSYHLTGAAQTWYYALEQDEGLPTWYRFKELYNLRFGPAIRGTRLAELAWLPLLSTVQDYYDRFNVVLCHARNLSAPQKAELFVGGLP